METKLHEGSLEGHCRSGKPRRQLSFGVVKDGFIKEILQIPKRVIKIRNSKGQTT